MNSEVVEKVAPLLELLPAVRVLALHYPTGPFGTCMLVSDDLIENGVRDVF